MIVVDNNWVKLKRVFPYTLPVLAGYGFLGLIFGILMNEKGFGPFYSLLMSGMIFAGSLQYALVTMLTLAFDPIQVIILSITINARHFFYGLTMLKEYRGLGKIQALLIFWLTDETYSLVSNVNPIKEMDNKDYYFLVSCLNYSYWVTASFIGGWVGQLGGFRIVGLDFALTALFVVILMDKLRDRANYLPALIGLVSSIICLMLFGQQFIIPSMVVIMGLLLVARPIIKGVKL